MKIKVGTCGWSYLNPEVYIKNWKEKFSHKLQAYAKLFDLVEVNSTFYKIPKLKTVEKWRKLVDEVNPKFEFTVKCSKTITHEERFSGKSAKVFEEMKEIGKALRARVLLFQSPASFKPTKKNIERVKSFFGKIERENFILVWEVRWEKNWTEEVVRSLFEEIGVNQCVDPFRQECFYCRDIVYYRLHGLGRPMYRYDFSRSELKGLGEKVKSLKKDVYVLFNNFKCYENGIEFKNLLSSSA